MNQDEIFNLLLIILLLSNDNASGAPCTWPGNINDLIIAVLLINSCSSSSAATASPTLTTPSNTTF